MLDGDLEMVEYGKIWETRAAQHGGVWKQGEEEGGRKA